MGIRQITVGICNIIDYFVQCADNCSFLLFIFKCYFHNNYNSTSTAIFSLTDSLITHHHIVFRRWRHTRVVKVVPFSIILVLCIGCICQGGKKTRHIFLTSLFSSKKNHATIHVWRGSYGWNLQWPPPSPP